MEQQTILFVDDEENVLYTLRRMFKREPYRVIVAGSGRQALEMIQLGERPSVIVSDQRMPEMTGAEFLEETAAVLPDSIRIMLTGYSDINGAMDAINRGGVYRYILKPWDDADLRLTVRDAVERYELVRQNQALTQELKEKNRALEKLNTNLERKVEERTRKLREAYEENLALTEQLRQKVKELEGRDRIQQHLLTIHPLEETLQTVLEVTVDVVGVDNAVIHLLDESGRSLRPVAGIGDLVAGQPGCSLSNLAKRPAHAQVFQEALDRGDPVNVSGGIVRVGEEDIEVCPFAAVPILKGGQRFGVIEVDRSTTGTPIGEDELRTILNFGLKAAVAISDSQLKEDLPKWEVDFDDVLRGFRVD